MDELWNKIGNTAGDVYHQLEKGELSVVQLKSNLKKSADSDTVMMALGWLAREDKVSVCQEGRLVSVKLK